MIKNGYQPKGKGLDVSKPPKGGTGVCNMSGWAIVGHCAKCGSPIYAPGAWMGITPPPSTPSCNCFPGTTGVFSENTSPTAKNPEADRTKVTSP